MRNALLIVDMQKDFMPGGSLAVAHADEIIPCINHLMKQFPLVVATKDFHPSGHVSFASSHPGKKIGETVVLDGKEQILWPDHCVQGTEGCAVDPRLDISRIHHFVHKGINIEVDSYSTFFDNAHNHSTGLSDYLKKLGVTHVFLCGVATDYCVLYSTLDALKLGFSVYVIVDACKGIDLYPNIERGAFTQMKKNGATLISSDEVLKYL